MFKGKFGGLKLAIKKWLLLFGYELIRDKEGNNKLKKIYSSKPAVQFMKDYNKKDNLIVAEVGVWKGDTTKHIIKILPIKKIYAIDSWTTFDSGEHDIRTMNNAEKIARKRLDKYKDKVKLCLQVHDELVLEVSEDLKDEIAEIVKYEMENVVKLEVPLDVEVAIGYCWGRLK